MRLAGQIAERATIAEVSRRRDPIMIESMVGFLESEWEARFSVDHPEERN